MAGKSTIRRHLLTLTLLASAGPGHAQPSQPADVAQGKTAAAAQSGAPGQATPPEARPELNPLATLRALSAYLTQDDINELYVYLRDSIIDSIWGTETASLPPDLAFKLAVLEQRFKKEGNAYLVRMLADLDSDLARFLHEQLTAEKAQQDNGADAE
jgi:hypothetical protein